MKKKTLFLLALLTSSIGGAIVFPMTDLPDGRLLGIASAALALLCLAVLTVTWLRYVSSMVTLMASSLGESQKISGLSFNNLDELRRNSELIKKKFDFSAKYIADLKDLEKDVPVDDFLRKDKIGEALMSIREEMAKLRQEEAKRNWITQGLVKFAEILRNKADMTEYSRQIVSNLAKYVGANQGILFIANESEHERYLQPAAWHACKIENAQAWKVQEGQGMVGQCMIDRRILLVKDVPKDYVKISSGLGQTAPRNIVIVPLIINEKLYGAVELASYTSFESHQVEFLREVSENIASEIAAIKNFEHTQKLLDDSNVLTKELRQHEDEMRLNMQELAVAQREMLRKQTELTEVLRAIDATLATAEFDLRGNIVAANEIFLKVLGYDMAELKGVPYQRLMKDDPSVHLMWENLRLGKFFSGEFRMRDKSRRELWLMGTFNPISISEGTPDKVMMFAQFTSQEKDKINDLNVVVNALKSTLPVVEFNDQFACRLANEKFLKLFNVSRLELKNRKMQDFIDPGYAHIFENISQEILSKDFISLLLPVNCKGTARSYEATLTVARDADGNILRLILILVREVEEKVPAIIMQ